MSAVSWNRVTCHTGLPVEANRYSTADSSTVMQIGRNNLDLFIGRYTGIAGFLGGGGCMVIAAILQHTSELIKESQQRNLEAVLVHSPGVRIHPNDQQGGANSQDGASVIFCSHNRRKAAC